MKILTVVGARPQFIKAAALSKAIAGNNSVKEILLHTGQHFDENMSEIFFKEMQIPAPDYQLTIHGLNHGAMTGRMLEGIEEVIVKEKPDCLLVYGDTNSTLAGALAAKKLHVKVAHVEAGLRSFNMRMPEEINRILTDRISDFLFCPTDTAIENLRSEGFMNFGCQIENTGDIMYDSMLLFSGYSEKFAGENIKGIKDPFVLCTIHRAENTDDPSRLDAILGALNTIAEDMKIILPLHPRTRQKIDLKKLSGNIIVTDPLGYFDMLYLLKHCTIVLTDSGGLQKEAFFNQKYCITLRDETEWIELVNNHCNTIAGAVKENIINSFQEHRAKKFTETRQFYGDGNAAQKIIASLEENLSK